LESDLRPPDPERGSYRLGIAALVLLVAIVVAIQIAGVRLRQPAGSYPESEREQYLRSGDLSAKAGLALSADRLWKQAEGSYRSALPWPSAYRRLGVLKEYLGKSGKNDFEHLDSGAKELDLTPKEVAKLRREKAMWLRIFSSKTLTPQEASSYERAIRRLNLGPLSSVAMSQVNTRAGQKAAAARTLEAAKARYRSELVAGGLLLVVLIVGGLAGVVIGVMFLWSNASMFASAPRSHLAWSTGVSAFIVYLASYIGFSAVAEIGGDFLGHKLRDTWADSAYLGLLIVSALVAYGIGMATLIGGTRYAGLDWREIGYRTRSAGRDVLTGVGGFFAALPLLLMAAIVTWILVKTVLRNFPTPEQPFEGILAQGNVLSTVLTFLAASVIAPIVEETFFRGVLYTALRGRMGVWAAVAISSAIFAVIHPLPGGFLPIFALACVFALMRERTGSVVPSIVAHSVYNTVQLLVVLLLF